MNQLLIDASEPGSTFNDFSSGMIFSYHLDILCHVSLLKREAGNFFGQREVRAVNDQLCTNSVSPVQVFIKV